MKKLILLSFCCLFGLAISAQTSAKAVVAEFEANVELTKAQKKQVSAIEKAFENDWKEIAPLKNSDPKQYYNKLAYMKEVKVGKVRELLTEDQMVDYRAFRQAKSKERTAQYEKMQSEGMPSNEIRIKLLESM